MEQKTKKVDINFIIIVICLLAILIGTSIFGIITYARYRSREAGNINSQIAKWAFTVNGNVETFETINLGKTIKYENVAVDKIAPGTQGSFNLIMDGTGSEVSIDYYIDIDVTDTPTNMKFYSDVSHTTEFEITADNKILLEDEILLANINIPVTKTIYWDWPYRTKNMPSEETLKKYNLNKSDIETQISSVTTQDEKDEILRKINDKIDTEEAGGEVLIPIQVKGIQKNPLGFIQKEIKVTSDTSKEYTTGDEITFSVEFTEGVYADENKTLITDATAPVLEFEFTEEDESTSANNPVAMVASLKNTGIQVAEGAGIVRQAEFVSVNGNIINYKYIIQGEDRGILKIVNYSGTVYNKKGTNLNTEKMEVEKLKVEYLSDGILLLNSTFNNGKIRDEILREDYVINGNVTNSTTIVKNGNGSAYFSGETNQRLRLDRSELNFGTDDFTIEFWVYPEEKTMSYPLIFSDESDSNFEMIISDIDYSNNITLRGNGTAGGYRPVIINTGVQCKVNEWTQYKVIRKKGEFKIYENGKLIGSTLDYKTMPVNLTNLAIGGNSNTTMTSFKGYIDDLKIYSIAPEEYLSTNTPNKLISIGDTYKMNVLNTESSMIFWNKRFANNDFTWTSSNTDIASIDASGNVKGLSVGSSTIIGYNSEYGLKIRGIVNVKNVNAVAIPQVIVGEGYTIALKEDGTVWTVGKNSNGVLGNGTNNNSTTQEQVVKEDGTYLTDIIKISSGYNYAMALTKDGEVYAWGLNNYGQLGIGNTSDINYAIRVKISSSEYAENIMDIDCGDHHSVILSKTGKVYVSGRDHLNQHLIYMGQTNYFVNVGLKGVIKVIAGFSNCGAMLENGQTIAWGHNCYGALESNPDNGDMYIVSNNIVDYIQNGYMAAYLNEDGDVYTSGRNNVYNLALGDTNNRNRFTKVQIPEDKKAKYIGGGPSNLMVQTQDNKVYVAGYNGNGQLCTGNTSNVPTLIELQGADNVLKLAEINEHYYQIDTTNIAIIKQDGTAWISGDNTYTQYGNGATNSHSLVQYGSEFLKLNARNEYIKIGQTLDINITECSRFNLKANISDVNQNEWKWESSNEDVASIDANTGVVTGVSIGYTTITGRNESKGLKVKAIINVYRNVEGAITYPQVVNGENFTAVLKEDGTVWTTGDNGNGQLGDGTNVSRTNFEQVKISENEYLTNVRKIDVGDTATVAITRDGKVYAWGNNRWGRLGVGDENNRFFATPLVEVDGEGYLENIIDVSIGHANTMVLDNLGNIYGCGEGHDNSLLQSGRTSKPVRLLGIKNCAKITSEENGGAAILVNGDAYIWGHNARGQLGTGNTSGSGSTPILLGNDILQIDIGHYSIYYLKENNTVWASGENNVGQLGDGTTNGRYVFKQVLDKFGNSIKAKEIKAGGRNLQIRGLDNVIYVTGNNTYGQLSNGTTNNSLYSIEMLYSNGEVVKDVLIMSIGSSNYNTNPRTGCVIKQDGSVWISGDNSYGQFGNGTTTSSLYLTQSNINVFSEETVNSILMINNAINKIM